MAVGSQLFAPAFRPFREPCYGSAQSICLASPAAINCPRGVASENGEFLGYETCRGAVHGTRSHCTRVHGTRSPGNRVSWAAGSMASQ